ncbi:hypothetical protein TWF506_003982 [Arthrobotrys conoides]|uniref:Uncharacterized protein n=1 Tax=Arthrobotrys conoides TaxID=74498 RepID=A0AAN8NG68_9PEZI
MMLFPHRPGRLIFYLLIITSPLIVNVASIPLEPNPKDISDQSPPATDGAEISAISKRQLPIESLNQLTSALSSTYKETPGPKPDNNPQIQGNDTAANLTRKEWIPSSMFYDEKGFYVRCNNVEFVYNLEPWNHPDFPEIQKEDWADFSKAESRKFALHHISNMHTHCKSCRCDEEGRIIRGPKGGKDSKKCSPLTVKKCALIYACYCTVDLIQPVATSTTATVEDYQAALDRIPVTARAANYGYRWIWGGNSLRFSELPLLRFGDGRLPPITPDPDIGPGPHTDAGLFMILDPRNGFYPPARGYVDTNGL